MSAFGGYRSGIYLREGAHTTQVAIEVKRQFDMGVEDMKAGRYEVARQRVEWVLAQDGDYPGATDLLTSILLLLNTTATPTQAATPTVTSTPDLRSIEELFTQAQQYMAAGDWSNAIDTMLKLRKDAPDFHAIEVDGMLYVALRNRGVEKIKNADLEGGSYDLALAERFTPLDVEARSYRTWSELYITGASFWEVDWPRVIQIFGELRLVAPYLMDLSGWTVTERLRNAYIRYGDQLALAGEWCRAQEQYQAALEITADAQLEPTAGHASDQCSKKSEGGKGTEVPETTPVEETPVVETPVVEPTLETTPTPTQTPPAPTETSETPYP
jgi:tetratricopeptide (TPR) repeat protein